MQVESTKQEEIQVLIAHIKDTIKKGASANDAQTLAHALYKAGYRRFQVRTPSPRARNFAEACTLPVWRRMVKGRGKGIVQSEKEYLYIEYDGHKWQLSKPLARESYIGEEIEFEKAWCNGRLYAYKTYDY